MKLQFLILLCLNFEQVLPGGPLSSEVFPFTDHGPFSPFTHPPFTDEPTLPITDYSTPETSTASTQGPDGTLLGTLGPCPTDFVMTCQKGEKGEPVDPQDILDLLERFVGPRGAIGPPGPPQPPSSCNCDITREDFARLEARIMALETKGPSIGVCIRWRNWSRCSPSCGAGRQVRSGICSGGNCPGNCRQSRQCQNRPCGGECRNWRDWSRCSASCGFGTQKRSGICYGGNCADNCRETRPCRVESCRAICGHWSRWSFCPATCGGGVQVRVGRCMGTNCTNECFESRSCVKPSCTTLFNRFFPFLRGQEMNVTDTGEA